MAANLYARSIFGEDALANLSIEKPATGGPDSTVIGHIRIRAKSQVIGIISLPQIWNFPKLKEKNYFASEPIFSCTLMSHLNVAGSFNMFLPVSLSIVFTLFLGYGTQPRRQDQHVTEESQARISVNYQQKINLYKWSNGLLNLMYYILLFH